MNTSYVIITPARNEALYIERTLAAVAAQTIIPQKWVVVSDGSTDATDELVSRWMKSNPWIELVRRDPDETRNFGSKAHAVRLGVEKLCEMDYSYICNLDADIEMPPNYYEQILQKFEENQQLGIAGGLLYEDDPEGRYPQHLSADHSVAGPVQMFRRKCWEEIGGYLPLRYGGVDAMAEAMARMRGWQVSTFVDLPVLHLRPTGTEKGSLLLARWKQGVMERSHGNDLFFELVKCLGRITERPRVLGCFARASGYLWAAIRRYPLAVPSELASFLRREQRSRLRRAVRGLCRKTPKRGN